MTPESAWSPGDDVEIGWGVAEQRSADTLSEALALVAALADGAHGRGPWFGGVAFPSDEPGFFGAARFVRPARLEVRTLPAPAATVRCGIGPIEPGWAERVTQATSAIARGELEKVVLARTVDVATDATAWDVFAALPAARRRFLFRGPGGGVLVGATPELLLRLGGGALEVDALAGSVAPGEAFTAKEHREHDVVVRALKDALAGLPVRFAPQVIELPYVRHLHTRLTAAAGGGFELAPLLARLFPTPAVAGAPRAAALDYISQHEGLARGWYAGAVGRVAAGAVDLAVALRCAYLDRGTARLFAGAGIVAGSRPQAEWEETERKLWPMRAALALASGKRSAA